MQDIMPPVGANAQLIRSYGAGGFRIGAAVSGAELGEHAGVKALWPGVVEGAELIGSTGVLGVFEAIRRSDAPVTGQKIRDQLETICNFEKTYMDGKLCYSKDQHEGVFEDALITVEIKGGKFFTVR